MHANETTQINPKTGKAPERLYINPKDKYDGSILHDEFSAYLVPGNIKDMQRKVIEGMLRHEKPYRPEDLKALNMENMPNASLGDLPRRIGSEENKWVDYIESSKGTWRVVDESAPPHLYHEISEKLSQALNETWSEDRKNVVNLQLVFRQFSTYSLGAMVWMDAHNPVPTAIKSSSIRFPAKTRITLDNFTKCVVDDSLTPQYLYKISKQKNKINGWIPSEIKKVLIHQVNSGRRDTETLGDADIEEQDNYLENRELNIRSADIYAADQIPVYHYFIKEYEEKNGKCISKITIAQSAKGWRIIRSLPHYYKDTDNFLCIATDKVGSDATISNLRGLGIELLELCRAKDIMFNAASFASFRKSVPIYQTANTSGAEAAEQIVIRPNGAFVGRDFQEVQTFLDPGFAFQHMDRVDNYSDSYQGIYNINAPNKRGVQRTRGEAELDFAKEQTTTNAQMRPIIKLFFEPLGQEFLNRIVKFPQANNKPNKLIKGHETVAKFWKKVQKLGLPFVNTESLKVTINPHNTPGGLDHKMFRAQWMMANIMPHLQTQAQRDQIVNDAIISITTYQGAQPYLNQPEEAHIATAYTMLLDSENADLAAASPRQAYPNQDHFRHLGQLDPQGQGHAAHALRLLAEFQQGIQSQTDPEPLDAIGRKIRAAAAFLNHINQHIELAAMNPITAENPQFQQYYDFSAQFQAFLQKMLASFVKQVKQRNPNAGQDPKALAILAKTQAEIQAIQTKAEAEARIMEQKTAFKLAQQQKTSQSRTKNKDIEFLVEQQIKSAKAQHEIELERAKQLLEQQEEQAPNQNT